MAGLGFRLFADDDWLDRARYSVTRRAEKLLGHWLQDDPKLDDEKLRIMLVGALSLTPLYIGSIETITLTVPLDHYRTSRPVAEGIGHLASAKVRYSGSAALWKRSPTMDYEFGLRGRIGENYAHLQTMIGSLGDVSLFKEIVEDRLNNVRFLLKQSHWHYDMFNCELPDRVESSMVALSRHLGLLRSKHNR